MTQALYYGNLTGTVTDGDFGQPVGGVTVKINSSLISTTAITYLYDSEHTGGNLHGNGNHPEICIRRAAGKHNIRDGNPEFHDC